jgi:hypothetical protein
MLDEEDPGADVPSLVSALERRVGEQRAGG